MGLLTNKTTQPKNKTDELLGFLSARLVKAEPKTQEKEELK